MVRATYDALGLISFYTMGPKEAHAWTVPRGTTARPAAGKIHTDLERGFIRAEVADIHTVLEHDGWDAAKAAGAVRLLVVSDYRRGLNGSVRIGSPGFDAPN